MEESGGVTVSTAGSTVIEPTVTQPEVLKSNDVSTITAPESIETEVKIEDFTPRGGDDDMLEGTEIKTSNNFDDNWSDSSSEVHYISPLGLCPSLSSHPSHHCLYPFLIDPPLAWLG